MIDFSVRRLSDKAVELGFVETISLDTIQRLLKKNELKPWRQEHWCLPKVGGEFVAAMEEVLDVYEQAYDPAHPVVCFDEKPVVLHADVRPTLPVAPGMPERIDYEYERKGTANLFFLVDPLRGWRQVTVTAQRTKQEYAEQMRWLADVAYPEAEYVRIVQDNLNTHTPGALYEAFVPEEARRILRRLQFHYTPKHASWLNMAEIEIGIFQRSCLRQKLGNEQQLIQQVAALQAERNAKHCTISWQFTAGDARVKLQRLYPKT